MPKTRVLEPRTQPEFSVSIEYHSPTSEPQGIQNWKGLGGEPTISNNHDTRDKEFTEGSNDEEGRLDVEDCWKSTMHGQGG